MSRNSDLLLTAIAPAIWGSTYIVTTEFLPAGYPLTVAMLRALPAGLLLLLLVRQLPQGIWWARVLVLGALNFSVFWWLLFVAAYRLPGGVAATVGAIQPLIVILLARTLLGSPIRPLAIIAAIAGMAGVALLILTPNAALDPIGIAAGLAGAVSMAAGTVLSRRWQPPVTPLTFTAWQLTAGGLLLLPIALLQEPSLPPLTTANLLGLAWLGLIGAALTYILWFRGIAKLEPSVVSPLGFLSPMTAVMLGWSVLGQSLSAAQILGMIVVLGSVWLSQRAQQAKPAPDQTRHRLTVSRARPRAPACAPQSAGQVRARRPPLR
ncbi:putative blue pigment (indigoidine) exporter [Aminobacter niigataensis]|uniref:Blue pigment (Indigoidine) exporter n=1 Tax=Aminobacter niigataensis TaxID=83265 RepID=A0ABR6L5K2_9HYPH|nr:EamA family transporter [Aminobacter niigataensis]MBB4651271.1 putative blue pigment (indigoidine) exporter [Aminobacter niigataensis]